MFVHYINLIISYIESDIYSNFWNEDYLYLIEWSEQKMYTPWVACKIQSKNLDFVFIIYKKYWRREANLNFCCVMFDLQFCPLAVKYENLAVKYKRLYFSSVKI